MNKRLNEVTKQKKQISDRTNEKETFGLEFVPSQETLDAMREAEDIASGKNQS